MDTLLDDIRQSYKDNETDEDAKAYYATLKVGDTIMIECYTGMGTGGKQTITDIKTKYNEDTGEAYPVICCDDQEFNGEYGYAMTPPIMYFIADE